MIRIIFSFVLQLLLSDLPAQPLVENRIEGELLVMLSQGTSLSTFLRSANSNRQAPARLELKRSLGKKHNIHLLAFDDQKHDPTALLEEIRQQSTVTAAQFNYRIQSRQTPDDPDYELQWGLPIISAPQVWDFTTGGYTANGDEIVLAILDTGYDIDHEDLEDNIWINPGEIPDDGIDNDGNGYIDDVVGWNFDAPSNEHPIDQHGHSIAGIIGAKGNNDTGVAGINWDIKMMLLTTEKVDQIIEGYQYVIWQREKYNETNGAEGAFVVATNASFGQNRTFCSEQPVWGAMYDLLGEAGVLTAAGTANSNWNVDEEGDMPTTCGSDYIISVLNTTSDDKKYQGSAYGPISIDLGAPGQKSFTTKPFNRYDEFNGNSAAAPHLTGAIGLLYSLPCENLASDALNNPAQTALVIRDALINGVDQVPDLEGLNSTGGRLNIFGSMEILQEACASSSGDLDIKKVFPNPTRNELFFDYETPNFEDYNVRVYNALGQLVFRETITPPRFSQKRHKIPTHNWFSGVYFLVLENGDRYSRQSFVVH